MYYPQIRQIMYICIYMYLAVATSVCFHNTITYVHPASSAMYFAVATCGCFVTQLRTSFCLTLIMCLSSLAVSFSVTSSPSYSIIKILPFLFSLINAVFSLCVIPRSITQAVKVGAYMRGCGVTTKTEERT